MNVKGGNTCNVCGFANVIDQLPSAFGVFSKAPGILSENSVPFRFPREMTLTEQPFPKLVELAREHGTHSPAGLAPEQDMAWYSIKERGCVDLRDPRTLSRSKLTSDVIELLENERVVLIASPRATGKTSLAALVCHELLNRSLDEGSQQTKKTEIASISILEAPKSATFADAFEKMRGIKWEDLLSRASDGYTVYIVVDDVEILYKGFAIENSDEFWKLVELVQTNKASNFRVLMLSSFGSSEGAPVAIPQDATIGIERLNFTPAEVQEYLKSWFLGNESLGDSANFFNFFFLRLTGGHVGLCEAAVDKLNESFLSRRRSSSAPLSAGEWVHLVSLGCATQDNDGGLFDALNRTRAVSFAVAGLEAAELEILQRYMHAESSTLGDEVLKKCIRLGIVVQTREGKILPSSPAIWRYLFRKRFGYIEHDQTELR